MANVVGKRYRCDKCSSEFIVTKGGNGTLVCCGQPMELKKQLIDIARRHLNVANSLGKRYRCAICGTEVLCTKAGGGEIICCGQAMKTQEAKPIPSSD